MANVNKDIQELQTPITVTLEEIKSDLITFSKRFPRDSIPHVTEIGEVNDTVHNLTRKKLDASKGAQNQFEVPRISEQAIGLALRKAQEDTTAKLVGLIAHLAYWLIFGHMNSLPLDSFHTKQMFVNIQEIRSESDTNL